MASIALAMQQSPLLKPVTSMRSPWVRRARHRWRVVSPDTKQKLRFMVSTAIGSCLFIALFEILLKTIDRLSELGGERPKFAFTFAYGVSYFVSILWQHALNRLLIDPTSTKYEPYCLKLKDTFTVYLSTLLMSSVLCTILVTFTGLSERFVSIIMLLSSGLVNYALLQYLQKVEHDKIHSKADNV